MGVIIEDEAVGDYFKTVFLYDWKDDVRNPIAKGCRDLNVHVGEEILFDASGSFDANPLEYKWDFDGDDNIDSTTSISKFTFDTPGSYRVVLNVSDSSGNHNTSVCMVTVTIRGTNGLNNVTTWIFYFVLVFITIFIIFLARRMSGGKNANQGKDSKKNRQ